MLYFLNSVLLFNPSLVAKNSPNDGETPKILRTAIKKLNFIQTKYKMSQNEKDTFDEQYRLRLTDKL